MSEQITESELQYVYENMTVAEYLQLDELSKKTLGSYIKKASQDGVSRAFNVGSKLSDVGKSDEQRGKMYAPNGSLVQRPGPDKEVSRDLRKTINRNKGVDKATDKITR